jgi:hypothetical protein
MWTLSYNNTELPLASWGLAADLTGEFVNKGRDTVTAISTEPFDAASAQFAWGKKVVIWRDRAFDGTSYSGGTIWFQGYVGELKRITRGGNQAIGYLFYGPWWLLERLQFKQSRQVFNGWTTPNDPRTAPTFRTVFLSESFLGEDPAELFWTNGQQICEILNFANECYNPTKRGATAGRDNLQDILQIGSIDPSVIFPKTRANTVFCSEAIVQVLRWSPTVVGWWDYTTSPPTLHFRDQANLATVAINISSDQEKQIQLAPRYDRQLAGVLICYKQVNTYNGVPWPAVYIDKYPDTITDYTPNVSTHTIDLAGMKVSKVQSNVSVLPLAAAFSASASDRVAFWLAADTTLQDPKIDPASIAVDVPVSVLDKKGNPVNIAAYPNVLLAGSGPLASWMPGVQWVEAAVHAHCSFQRYADDAHKQPAATVTKRLISHRVVLTNAVTALYQGYSHIETGEQVPPLYPAAGSLAFEVYQGLSQLQYGGTIAWVNDSLRSDAALGRKLTLQGPNNTYSGLLAQSVRARPHFGELTVEFGPGARLDAPELIELARATRWRYTYNMPSGRGTGVAAPAAHVDLGAATARENTAHGLGNYSLWGVSFDQGNNNGVTTIIQNAQSEQLQLARLDVNGNVMTTDSQGNPLGSILLSLPATAGHSLAIVERACCDPATGAQKRYRVLASEPY